MNEKHFDLWSDNYDKEVELSDESNTYPFAAYKDIMNYIYKLVRTTNKTNILDLGIGTGTLATKLYNDGYQITGVDFSTNMLAIIKEKCPNIITIKHDFSKGIPTEITNNSYDFIIITYSIHHLKDAKKVEFIKELLPILKSSGKIIIGDVMFNDQEKLEQCKKLETNWDDSEYYITYDYIKEQLKGIATTNFIEMSYCSGIIEITN